MSKAYFEIGEQLEQAQKRIKEGIDEDVVNEYRRKSIEFTRRKAFRDVISLMIWGWRTQAELSIAERKLQGKIDSLQLRMGEMVGEAQNLRQLVDDTQRIVTEQSNHHAEMMEIHGIYEKKTYTGCVLSYTI